MSNLIDLLIGVYGWADDVDGLVAQCLNSLSNGSLEGVNVFCVERDCKPVSSGLRTFIQRAGFHLRQCPLPPFVESREDTAQFSNWMVDNVGDAPWATVSHFDVVFDGDYFGYVRSMSGADMVGNHHDGVVSVKRESYYKCDVGFCGVGNMCIIRAGTDVRIVPWDSPDTSREWSLIGLDVGELLALRMNTLGLRHVWHNRGGSEFGKSDLFTHSRQGSGHGRG